MSYMRSHSLGAPIDLYLAGRAHQDPRNRAATLSPEVRREPRGRVPTPAPMYERYAPYPTRLGPEGMARNQPDRGDMDELEETVLTAHKTASLDPHGRIPQTPRTPHSRHDPHEVPIWDVRDHQLQAALPLQHSEMPTPGHSHGHYGSLETVETLSRFNAPMNPDGTFVDILRRREDFPHVPYWFPNEWDNRAKPVTEPGQLKPTGGYTRLKAGENVQCGYITNPDGTPISAARSQELRAYHYQFNRDFALEFGPEKLPTSWVKGATTEYKESYYAYMKARSLECQTCYRAWYAERIAIDNYPQWRLQYLAGLDLDDYPLLGDDSPELARDDIDGETTDNTATGVRRARRPANSRKYHITARERKTLRQAIIHAKKQMAKRKAARKTRAKGKSKAAAKTDESESELEYAEPEPQARIDDAPFVIENRADDPTSASASMPPPTSAVPHPPPATGTPTASDVAAAPVPPAAQSFGGVAATHTSPVSTVTSAVCDITPAPAAQLAQPGAATPPPRDDSPAYIHAKTTMSSNPREQAAATIVPEAVNAPLVNNLANHSHPAIGISDSLTTQIAPDPTQVAVGRTRIPNPFAAMATLPQTVRDPVPAAAVGPPIPLNQDLKKKRTKKPKTGPWPPVVNPNSPQKDVCAVLWHKIYEGTRDTFEAFYAELRTDAARKRWYKKALADQVENGVATVPTSNASSGTVLVHEQAGRE
ncbi:hypothetical protein C8Q76DRAFT_789499 [Earliella scabrosa]|nr:hypothetical protein C8Q76DRAFT_789499 [Earliella scabrosa]